MSVAMQTAGKETPFLQTPGPYYPTVNVVSPTKAILTFNEPVAAESFSFVTGLIPYHTYKLTVNGSQTISVRAFSGLMGPAYPTAELELPESIRAGRVYQGTIRYSNTTSDLLAPLLVLSANKGTQLSLTEDFSDATNTLQVLGLGKNDPGRLADGDSGEITFYFKSEGNVNIDLGCLYYKDNEACDDTTYFATWREYHEALIAATKRLNARGKTNYSAQDAFALAVQTKLGEPASAISGYLEDSRDLEPIAGATLFARWIAEDGATRVRYFETDENGWFSLDYLPANTTFTLGTVDADALSQTTVTLGDSDVNGLRLTALSKDKTQTRAVAVGADLLAYVVYDKASLTNNRTAQATLIVQNTSDKPVDAALLTLTATNDRGERNAMLTLDASQAQVPYYSTFMPDGFASSISLLTSGAQNGVLGPGETLEIPVYWSGWVKPWDSASFEFELSLVEKTETTALDAAEMEKSLRESFTTSRGAAWADDEWALVWASASETFGSTWGDYVSALIDASATAAQNGREANNVDKLTQTIFARALDAFSPFAIPASSVDAAVGSDASSLTFERVYLGDLSKRFLDSPLGRGWRHNWDYALRSNDDGTVYIDTPSGATRAFQPSRRGAAGTILTSTGTDDQGVLLRASDGTFELTELEGTKALFDADGRLTRIVDANGNAVDLTYDGAGLLTRVADGWGHSLTLRYSAKRLVAVVDSNGDETTFERDGAYLTKATGPTGRSVSYRYGDSGGALNALSEIEFADGTTRRFEYDATGRRVGVVDSDGAAERIEWLDATSYKVFDGDVCQGTVYLNDDGAPIKSVDAL
ncbi:MAG: RHS repeat protein, partial [Thermoguttaceae bacterium]|nr:RHS repeat protein [Thermoguttaceae bacterium]